MINCGQLALRVLCQTLPCAVGKGLAIGVGLGARARTIGLGARDYDYRELG